jgi:hypothetical protein
MKHLPALSAETANPAGSGSKRQRDQQNKSKKADGDKRPLGDVFPHGGQIEGLVGAEIREEVQADVKKSEKAEHAAETDEIGKVEELAERRDAESEDEEAERPVTGGMLEKFDGVGAQLVAQGTIDESEKREETKQEDKDFGPFAGEDRAHSEVPA